MATRQVAGEALLVPVRGRLAEMQKIFALNPVAGHIWQELDGKRSLGEIRDSILARFDVEREAADRDVREFIEELLEAGLLERRE